MSRLKLSLEETAEVPADLDDRLVPSRLVGMKPFFLRAFFASRLEGIEPALLVARDDRGRLLGAFAFARMSLPLDCIAPPAVQRLAGAVRGAWPSFLVLRMAMFGIPASMADQESVFAPGADPVALREAAVEHSLGLQQSERLAACVWKEFDAEALTSWRSPLEQAGFLFAASVPVSLQEVSWDSRASYEQRLRSSYRRQLKANSEKAAAAGLQLAQDLDFAPYAGEFHPLYLQVLARSKTRLETLTPEFFHALAADSRVRYIRATLRGRPAGGALCYVEPGDILIFLYVGMDYEVMREADVYFNLMAAIVELAGARSVKRIRWGQTSPDAKGRMGASLEPLSFAIRFRSRALQAATRAAGGLLFPSRSGIERKVFR